MGLEVKFIIKFTQTKSLSQLVNFVKKVGNSNSNENSK